MRIIAGQAKGHRLKAPAGDLRLQLSAASGVSTPRGSAPRREATGNGFVPVQVDALGVGAAPREPVERLTRRVAERSDPCIVAADGANGVNAAWERGAGPGFYSEEQRHGEEAILDGLARHSSRLWHTGLREFTWGLARQGPAGDFPGTHDPFHSTSFFVEGVAHTILVVRAGAAAGLPVPGSLVHALDRLVGRLHRAARWMARADVWRAGIEGEAPFTHRRFLVTAAVGLTGRLTGDRTLERLGHQAMLLGLARQRPDGVFPELGGPDSSD